VTAGTIFQDTRTPLSTWFRARCCVTSNDSVWWSTRSVNLLQLIELMRFTISGCGNTPAVIDSIGELPQDCLRSDVLRVLIRSILPHCCSITRLAISGRHVKWYCWPLS